MNGWPLFLVSPGAVGTNDRQRLVSEPVRGKGRKRRTEEGEKRESDGGGDPLESADEVLDEAERNDGVEREEAACGDPRSPLLCSPTGQVSLFWRPGTHAANGALGRLSNARALQNHHSPVRSLPKPLPP